MTMTCTYDFDKTAFSALNEKVKIPAQLKSHVNSHDVFAKGREKQKKSHTLLHMKQKSKCKQEALFKISSMELMYSFD